MSTLRRDNKFINYMIVDSSYSHVVSCFYNSQLIWGGGEEKPDPLSALYRRWSFDTLYDSVADVPMTLYGNAHLDNGSLVINGSTQQKVNYAQLSGNNWPFSSETGATVEFWITPTALRNWQRTWCAGDGSDVNFFDYAKYGLAEKMLAAINVNGTQTLFTPPLLNLNVMQHIAVVYDITPASGTDLTVYQFQPSHGLQTTTGHTDAVMADAWQGSNVWYLGRTMYDGWGDPDFDGSMQEFRVWNRPLTYDEIVACDEAGPDEMPDWTPKPPVPEPSGTPVEWIELPDLASMTGAPALSVIEDPTDTMKIQIDWMPTNATGDILFGIPYPDDNHDFRLFNYQNMTFYDRGSQRLMSSGAYFPVNQRTVVEIGNYYITSEYGNQHRQASSYTPPTSPLGFYGYAYIYGLKIWDGDTLVRDMVPWRDSEGVGCLSCSVSNRLYYARDGVTVNAGQGGA